MARDRSHAFLRHWKDRGLELEDGRRLSWFVIDDPGRPAWIPSHKLDGRAIHWSEGRRLLAAAGHPDAALPDMGSEHVDTSARLHR